MRADSKNTCYRCGSIIEHAFINGLHVDRCGCYPEYPRIAPCERPEAARLKGMVKTMVDSQDLAEVQPNAPMTAEQFMSRTKLMKAVVGEMLEGIHFGMIPGTKEKSLWEPGAKKLVHSVNFLPS